MTNGSEPEQPASVLHHPERGGVLSLPMPHGSRRCETPAASEDCDLSVVICTLNRHALLAGALSSLAAAARPEGHRIEILVVDNGSCDPTPDVVAGFAERLPVRRIVEQERGLSHARNAGLKAAHGRYIIWQDDDARASSDILCCYAAAIGRHPSAAIFGGTIRAELESPTPSWILEAWDHVKSTFAALDPPPDDTPISLSGPLPYGANFAVSRDVQRLFPFDPMLGRRPGGRRIVGGEETDSLRRMLRAGYSGVWVASAAVTHWIPVAIQTVRRLRAYYEGQGWEYRRGRSTPRKALAAHRRALIGRMIRLEAFILMCRCAGRPARAWIPAVLEAAFVRGELSALADPAPAIPENDAAP